MKEYQYCYKDLKPENIFLVLSEENKYILKLIDFEVLEMLDYNTYTPAFFNSPMR
jgi:serine/threonine protein kinase